MSQLTQQLALQQALTHLEASLAALGDQLLSAADYPAWVSPHDKGACAQARAVQIYSQLDYQDGQAGNESDIVPGILGVGAETLALAETVNAHKQALRQALLALQQDTIEFVDAKGNTRRMDAAQYVLNRMGHARLHRLQAWRQIPILDHRPKAVWFAWVESKKVYRISCAEACDRLESLGTGNPHIAQQLLVLRTLGQDTPLAVVQEARPHARANLYWEGRRMTQVRSSMPLLYPARPGEPLPALTPIDSDRQKRTQRRKRSDVRLADEPLLPSIRAYTYLGAATAEA